MIATYNIKVNGRWYAAGEEVPDQQQVIEEVVNIPETEKPVKEKPAKEETDQKPMTGTTRRRTAK